MNTLPKQRGRPKGNGDIRALRSRIWYLNVKMREGLSDCKLDVKFGSGPGQPLRNTADRIKVFEAIRTNGFIPADGSLNKRGFDLVAFVDGHTGYEGTAAIIHSPFWKLMEHEQLSVKEIREIVIQCVSLLGLAPLAGNFQDDGRDYLKDMADNNPKLTFKEYFYFKQMGDDAYENALSEAFLSLAPSLDYAALLFALGLEAIAAGNMQIAYDLMRAFNAILEMFARESWMCDTNATGKEICKYARKRYLAALNADALKGLSGYAMLLEGIANANVNSPIGALLIRHERMLWRKGVTVGSHIPRRR